MHSTTEIWCAIKGYEGSYAVSNHGRVKSLDRTVVMRNGISRTQKGCILKPSVNTQTGYESVCLWRDNAYDRATIHRLVAAAFVPNPDNKPEVNHIDSNRRNNHWSNLEWVTRQENILHGVEVGNIENPAAKLTKKEVREIRSRRLNSGTKLKALARDYGVTESAISNIINHKTWTHVE